MDNISQFDTLDYEAIMRQSGVHRNNEIDNQFAMSQYVSLTKAHLAYNRGGAKILDALQKGFHRGMEWKIQVSHHLDGREANPGDEFRWQRSYSNRDKHGRKYDAMEILELRRMGQHTKLYEYGSAKLDENNCIVVGYHDASSLLSLWGYCVMGDQTYPITKRKQFAGGKEGKPERPNWIIREVLPHEELGKKVKKKHDTKSE